MKIYIRILFFVAVAIVIAFFAQFNDGHIILFLNNYRFDMTFSLFVLAVILLFIMVYYLIRASINIHRIPSKIKRWQQNHALLVSRKYLNNAGINFFEGKFGSAYKNAVLSTNKETNVENKFLGLMLAFKSSNYMRNYVKESEILDELDKFQQQKWQLAKFMALSENLYNEQKYNQCIDSLNQVLGIDKKHIPASRLLLKTYLRLENYNKSFDILTWLVKHDYLDPYRAQNYKIRVFNGLFSQIADIRELNLIYYKLDKTDKNNLMIGKFYLVALIRLKSYNEAISYIAKTLALNAVADFSHELLTLAKELKEKDYIQNLLNICEKLIVSNKSSSNLLVLGILSYSLNNFGKSTEYLYESIRLKPSLNAYLYLLFVARATNNQILLDNVQNKLMDFQLC